MFFFGSIQCSQFANSYLECRRLRVKLGKHDVSNENEQGVETRKVSKYYIHPDFKPFPKFYNDIAVLKLKHDVPYRYSIYVVKKYIYRVIKKEGNKVGASYTSKKCIFGAIKRFILTIT